MNKALITIGIISIFIVMYLSFSMHAAYSAHSITICGKTYVCGVKDGVCPEDYPGFGKCDVSDPDCKQSPGPTPPGPTVPPTVSAPVSVITPTTNYKCTNNMEVDIFNKISNHNIFSLGGYCLDLRINSSYVVSNTQNAEIDIINYHITPETNLSVYKAFMYNFSVQTKGTTIDFRVPNSWASGIIKRSISLYYINGTKINTTYIGKVDGFYYYRAKTDASNIIVYIAGEKKPSIWYIIEEINKYYNNEVKFTDVVKMILDYYE